MQRMACRGDGLWVCGFALLAFAVAGCSGRVDHGSGSGSAGNAASGGASSALDGGGGAMGSAIPSPVTISVATKTPRTTTWSLNYWLWPETWGNYVAGTEPLVQPLSPALLRVGGYNNDANSPEPFGDSEMDAAVAYARAIGAEPLIQVPLLADIDGMPPTAATAAAMVKYANITKGYGVKYFSIGNEPDIYADQGGLVDSTQPAIAGYTPDDYCASATAYVAQMKSVDPTIQIVGPDLASRYIPNSENDWLTPILKSCGALFDVVAIHRYPFDSAAANVARVSADLPAFESVVSAVHGIMSDAGVGDKPLAITEMNVAYDALPTTNPPDAGCGTVPSALWVADSLGTSANLGLWTTAIWDISDTDDWSLGILGGPPAHNPRPEYYAYALYAQYFGPTLVNVTSVPAGVRAYATRNAADDETDVIVTNWNTDARALSFQVTDLSPAPATAVYTLPALSLAAVQIPDQGAPTAWTYGSAQFAVHEGAGPLATGVTTDAPPADAGTIDAALTCPSEQQQAPITVSGTGSAGSLSYGPPSDRWGSYLYAATGQPMVMPSVTADGNGFTLSASLVSPSPADQNYVGFGLYYNSGRCIDASEYTGIQFDLSGDLGTCALAVSAQFSADLSTTDDAVRGSCNSTAGACYPPSAAVSTIGTVKVAFADMTGGAPASIVDKTSISSLAWQLTVLPDSTAPGCTANFRIENVSFY
jgi:hypothetical protein